MSSIWVACCLGVHLTFIFWFSWRRLSDQTSKRLDPWKHLYRLEYIYINNHTYHFLNDSLRTRMTYTVCIFLHRVKLCLLYLHTVAGAVYLWYFCIEITIPVISHTVPGDVIILISESYLYWSTSLKATTVPVELLPEGIVLITVWRQSLKAWDT